MVPSIKQERKQLFGIFGGVHGLARVGKAAVLAESLVAEFDAVDEKYRFIDEF